MTERDEPDTPPLSRDATVRHIRLIRSQLKRHRSNDPEDTPHKATHTPRNGPGHTADGPGATSTSEDDLDPTWHPEAPSNTTLGLLQAELARPS